ncbi:MAG TPA: RluA family pseudouridine synthase [Spirochaetaceae bacterium]|jgi:23S rRNA pseudouridine1911/1915/1917 synthase|nr:RluA family pseudouridine synthase [Spirochaetaceae bacterium]
MAELEGLVQGEAEMRLDRYIADELGSLSRSQLKLRSLAIRVNGREAKLSRLVKPGDSFAIVLKDEEAAGEAAEELELDILYEDASVIVLNKAQGMVTHPAHGNWRGTLANGLLGLFKAQRDAAEAPSRAGIVHRLDKDTSGLIIAAKTAAAQEFLAAQFRDRTTRKIYLAVCQGVPAAASGRIDTWLARDPRDRKRFCVSAEGDGKHAQSDYKLLGSAEGYALLALRPRTGRTHQLRVHCKRLGCPILGDPIYGRKDKRFPEATLMLHARELMITLPGEAEARVFSAPIPERFLRILRLLALETLV